MSVTAPRVFVVHEHPFVCAGLIAAVTATPAAMLVGQAQSGAAAVEMIGVGDVDVALVGEDLLEPVDAVGLCATLTPQPYLIKCLVIGEGRDASLILALLRAGATGYLGPRADLEVFQAALTAVAAGNAFFDEAGIASLVAVAKHVVIPTVRLTSREAAVMRLVVRGKSNSEIAAELGLSFGRVKNYVSILIQKLGVSTRAEAVATALNLGLLRNGGGGGRDLRK